MNQEFVILSDNGTTIGMYPREVFEESVNDVDLDRDNNLVYSHIRGYYLQYEVIEVSNAEHLENYL